MYFAAILQFFVWIAAAVAGVAIGLSGSASAEKAIGEVLGFPITCHDYGKVRIGYLISIGEAKEGDCLADVFGQSWNSGYRGKLFVTKK